MAVAYNSSTAVITVTQGTSGTPLTPADVLAADVAAKGTRNLLTYSETLSNAAWTKTGSTGLASVTGPLGLAGWSLTVGAYGALDIRQEVSSLTTGTRYAMSIWVKRTTSTTGKVAIVNTKGMDKGEWQVDLSKLDGDWERITRAHPAVTVKSEFVGVSSACGVAVCTAYPDTVTVSGTLSPDATGTYTRAGYQSGRPYYSTTIGGTAWYIRASANGYYYIATSLDTRGSLGSWDGPIGLIGSYSATAPATGTATVSGTLANLTLAIAAPQLEAAYPDRVVVTGTLSPDATGVYVQSGTCNGPPCYKRESDGAYWIWWRTSDGTWLISQILGTAGTTYRWYGSSALIGNTYTAGGSATGTATVSPVYTRLTVSGTLSPAVGGDYLYAGNYNGQPYYASASTHDNGSGTNVTWYVWFDPTINAGSGGFRITTGTGVPSSCRWAGNSTTSVATTYNPFGSSTGTATVAADTTSGQNTISDYQKSGWGQSTQPLAGVNHGDLLPSLAIGDGVTSTYFDLSAWDINFASGKSLSIAANAQVKYAVKLKVVNQSGAPLSGAVVTLTNAAAAQVWQATTGADGLVNQTAWTSGNNHTLTVAATGKETLTLPAWAIVGNVDQVVEVIDEVFTSADRTKLEALYAGVNVTQVNGAAVTTATDYAKAGDAMALTAGERTTLAGVVWDKATSGLIAVGSIGKWIVDKLNFTYVAPPTPPSASEIRQEIDANSTRLEAIESIVDTLGPGVGDYALTHRVLQADGITPAEGATVKVWDNSGRTGDPIRRGVTDSSGYVYFNVGTAGTYYLSVVSAGGATVSDTEVVA